MPAEPTRDRLLDAAERLYAERGIDATSLRAITQEAGSNVASVNYHFGSKQELTREVFARRLVPLNADRIRRLDSLETGARETGARETGARETGARETGGGEADVPSIVGAFVDPALATRRDPSSEQFLRLMGRMHSEPSEELMQLIHSQFSEVVLRFSTALGRALPQLPPAEIFWRFHFLVGAMVHSICNLDRFMEHLGGGTTTNSDASDRLLRDRLVAFVTAGFEAPIPESVRLSPASDDAPPFLRSSPAEEGKRP